jgi:hypothetical protein
LFDILNELIEYDTKRKLIDAAHKNLDGDFLNGELEPPGAANK